MPTVSSFDRVHSHLQQHGEKKPMRLDQIDDLEILVQRHEQLRELGPEYSEVRLSSYMESLLGVTREHVTPVDAVSVREGESECPPVLVRAGACQCS